MAYKVLVHVLSSTHGALLVSAAMSARDPFRVELNTADTVRNQPDFQSPFKSLVYSGLW